MKIKKKYLQKNHMTRSGEKVKKIKYIVIHQALNKNLDVNQEYNYIKNLSNQDELYYSVHYIIGKSGECIQIIPEHEIAYSTMNIELNYYIISIECCYEKSDKKFGIETENTLKKLLSYLKEKYNLSKEDIILHYDITGSRCPIYYVDHKYEYLDILENI